MRRLSSLFFFFNDTATTEIYTLSLHDALPISHRGFHRAIGSFGEARISPDGRVITEAEWDARRREWRSEEHTSELQSQSNLVCRLLLEKKKTTSTVSKTGCTSHTKKRILVRIV